MKKSAVALSVLCVALLAGCNGESSSSPLSSSTSSPSVSSSSAEPSSPSTSTPEPVVTTEALTDAMLQPLNGGYAADIYFQTIYTDSNPSAYFMSVKCNADNYDLDEHYVEDDGTIGGTLTEGIRHYQKNPSEADSETPMLYNASLSIGNKVIYEQVYEMDPYTYEDVALTWEEGRYSNGFAALDASDFTRDGTENRFDLKMDDPELEETYELLAKQLFGEETSSDLETLTLLTNGDKITGFEATYEQYLAYDGTPVVQKSEGTFTALGADVTSEVQPMEGEEDPTFKAAIDKLKADNWTFEAQQKAFDYMSNTSYVAGTWKGEADGDALVYKQYDGNDVIFAYGYYSYYSEEDQHDLIQGVVPINGKYYQDIIAYYGTMADMFPSFDISSLFFVKDPSSTEDKLVYKINPDIYVSDANNITAFTSFDSDSYSDLIIHMTITITDDSITIHNQTAENPDEGGLVYDITYSGFGSQNDLMPEEDILANCDDLKWTDILSNQQGVLKDLTDFLGEDNLNDLPTFGAPNVGVDVTSLSNPWFVLQTYSEEQNAYYFKDYQEKLVAAGYTDECEYDEDGNLVTALYTKKITVKGTREYLLNVNLDTFWNSIQDWGQFQVGLSFSSVK